MQAEAAEEVQRLQAELQTVQAVQVGLQRRQAAPPARLLLVSANRAATQGDRMHEDARRAAGQTPARTPLRTHALLITSLLTLTLAAGVAARIGAPAPPPAPLDDVVGARAGGVHLTASLHLQP